MDREIIVPKDESEWLELRKRDITSTEISALFGLSPYCTELELWLRKKNNEQGDFEETDWIKWGRRLQDGIASGVAEDEGWSVRRMDEYIRDPELRMGASFDFSIEDAAKEVLGFAGMLGLLEIKNVFLFAFKEGWTEDDAGNLEAPPHIELQVQHQLAVSGRAFAYICALVGGNKVIKIRREPDPDIIAAIKQRVREFWASIDANVQPALDYSRDAKTIAKLYGYADPGKIYDARGGEIIAQLCEQDREQKKIIDAATLKRKEIKARLLEKIGDAEKVIGDGFTITAGMIGPASYQVDREGYRNFRINWPKGKKTESVSVAGQMDGAA